jgi:tight adherence protein B
VTPTFGLTLTMGSLAMALGYLAASDEVLGFLRTRLESRRQSLDFGLRFLRSKIAPRALLGVEVLGVCLLLLGVGTRFWVLVGVALCLGLAPHLLLERARVRRVKLIHLQVEPFLGAMARALAAAPSLGEAIVSASQTLRGGLADELAEVLEEFRLGTPLETALERMALRVPSENVRVAVLTLTLGARSGGRLDPVLQSMAAAMREMERLEGVLRSKTAEGKAQILVIACLPAAVALALAHIEPGFFEPLDASLAGHTLVAVAVFFWAAGVLLARHITAVDL